MHPFLAVGYSRDVRAPCAPGEHLYANKPTLKKHGGANGTWSDAEYTARPRPPARHTFTLENADLSTSAKLSLLCVAFWLKHVHVIAQEHVFST